MKILTGTQIREADLQTMKNDPISSIDLMERAALALAKELRKNLNQGCGLVIFAGKGNNGGDGYALARLLEGGFDVAVVRVGDVEAMTAECRTNFGRLPGAVRVLDLEEVREFCGMEAGMRGIGCEKGVRMCGPRRVVGAKSLIIIDALLGTGVRGPVRGRVAEAIALINVLRKEGVVQKVISIDMPSGLPTEPEGWRALSDEYEGRCGGEDASRRGALSGGEVLTAVRADETLTLEFPKLSLLLPATGAFAGRVKVIGIGLDRDYIESCASALSFVGAGEVCGDEIAADRIGVGEVGADKVGALLPERAVFAHKGNFGHAMIIAGSRGMMGAAVLATGAALRSGCGLVTAHIPENERFIMQVAHPSAIVDLDPADSFSVLPAHLEKYSAIGIGCGLRQNPDTVRALGELLTAAGGRALVLDADALNIIAARPEFLERIPSGSVLTPHIGELRRLLDCLDELESRKRELKSRIMTSGPDSAAETRGVASETDPALETGGAASGPDSADILRAGAVEGDLARIMAVRRLAERTQSVIVVKGAHTMIVTPDGRLIFNMSGNPGMAKGGSGDVLTGLIAGLRARGLSSEAAAIVGVFYHGRAGDAAAKSHGEGSMNASDILSHITLPR